MSDKDVRFASGQFTYCGSRPVSPSALGKDIVVTLFRGLTYTDFGLEPEFAVDSVRHTGRTGSLFYSIQQDAYPFGWESQEAERLRQQSDQILAVASDIADSGANEPIHGLNGATVSDNLLLSADHIRRHAGALFGTGSNGPLSKRYCLPKVKLGWEGAHPRVITWEPRAQAWNFGGHVAGVALLGRLIVLSLLRGHETVSIGEMRLSVNYLADMVRLTGRNGRFREVLDGHFNMHAASVYAQAQR